MRGQAYSLAEYGVWAVPINRTVLAVGRRAAWLPWTVTVRVRRKNSTVEVERTRFTVVDPYSDAYLSWLWGNPVSVSDFRTQTADGGKALTIRNPCNPQITILIRTLPDTAAGTLRVYFSVSWSMSALIFTGWRKVATLPSNCTLTAATGLPAYIILHTACGAYVTDRLVTTPTGNERTDAAPRAMLFSRAAVLDGFAADAGATASEYCYIRTSPSKIGSTVAFKNAAGVSGVVVPPFQEFITPLLSYRPQNDSDPSAPRTSFFTTIRSNPAAIITSLVHPATNLHYTLYRANGTFSLFAQPLSDLRASLPSGRILTTFPDTFQPRRFQAHPLTQHLYLLGNQLWMSADGARFQLLHDREVTEVTFSPGGTQMAVRSPAGVMVGGAFGGALFPVGCTVDGNQAVTFGPDERLYVLDGMTNGGAARCEVQREVVLPGAFAMIPVTSAVFYLLEWDTGNGTRQLTEEFVGYEFRHVSNASTSSGDYDSGVVVDFLPETFVSTTIPDAGSLLQIEQSSPLLASASDLSMGQLSTQENLTLTFTNVTAPVTFALSTSGADWSIRVAAYSTLIAEQWDPYGGLLWRGSFIVTALNPATGWALTPVPAWISTVDLRPGEWRLVSISNLDPTAPAWVLRESAEECPYLLTLNGSTQSIVNVYLDRGDTATLVVSLKPTFTRRQHRGLPNRILAFRTATPRLHITSRTSETAFGGYDLTYTIEEVGTTSQADFWSTTVTFTMTSGSSACRRQLIVLNIVSGCLKGSGLRYVFPDGMSDAEYVNATLTNKIGDPVLGPIPVNYRPPSDADGIDFPRSPNVYNADVSQPVRTDFAAPDQFPVVYKQCDGCCTEDMRRSMLLANSECLTQAVYLPFSGDHLFQLRLDTGTSSGLLPPSEPVLVQELNNRTAFSIVLPDGSHTTLDLLRARMGNTSGILVASNSTIRFTGTGLFHLRASALPESSYCTLSTEWMLWVYQAPLAFPLGQICQVVTLLVVSVWLFVVLTALGEATLVDRRRRTAQRMPDRIPLVDAAAK
ncbi:cation channel sperm-associated auxiliary subunit beta-like isoform X2 [Paramacrobiotus metropolitanus]|nr:cation channel sperm-associated auxiliary subunit beta-like isoform X2 [Paramacrobiotus metropolitanus]